MLLEPSVGRRNSWTGVGEAWSDGRGRIILRLRRLPEHASRARRGGKSPRAQPTARPAAASRAQSPALCQVLPWTRRRKHLRGPFGPEVDQGAAPQRRKANRTQNNPFARGTTQPSRPPKQRRRSASSARPHARRAADICARSGGPGLGHVGRGGSAPDLMRVAPESGPSQTCRSMDEHLPMSSSGLPVRWRSASFPIKVERRVRISSPCTRSKHCS